MVRIVDILNEVSVMDVAEYMAKERKNMDVNLCMDLVNSIKALDVEASDVKIIDMIVVYTDSTCENPSYSNSVVGFRNVDSEDFLYDISHEKWNRILGMEIANTCFQHLLPAEIVGDVLLEMTRSHNVSPKNPQLIEITEENFSIPRELAYKACNVKDDRTESEKDFDSRSRSYEYSRARDLFLAMVRNPHPQKAFGQSQ